MTDLQPTFDLRRLIDEAPMSRLQIIAVLLTIALNALDGFDVLSISFASPGIAEDWGVGKAALGAVLSMELIGMMIGSIFIGGLADRLGRRPTILTCLTTMAIGMALASRASGLAELSAWRLLTGLGIGGMLAATNAAAAEFANARRRGLALSLMAIGFPIGGVVGGAIVGQLLGSGDWREVFLFGALATTILIPIVWFLLPETVTFLVQRRPAGADRKLDRILARMGRPPLGALPEPDAAEPKATLRDILTPVYARLAAILVIAFFADMISFYFVIKWAPKIAVDSLHVSAGAAASVLTWANAGGVAGGALFGALTMRFGLRGLTIGAMLASSVMIVIFGLGQPTLGAMAIAAAGTQFFAEAGVVGLYSLAARTFPPELRGTGTGLMIGLGRGGAALSPILVGRLFEAHFGLLFISMIVAACALIASGALTFLRPVSWVSEPALATV